MLISIAVEIFVFNSAALFSRICGLTGIFAEEQMLTYTVGEGFVDDGQGRFRVEDYDRNYLEINELHGKPGYLFLDIDCQMPDGTRIPVDIEIAVTDEGNVGYYCLPKVTVYPVLERSKYFRIHSYGELNSMRISLSADSEAIFTVNRILYNAKVPFRFSAVRIVSIWGLLGLLWLLRPGASIYCREWKSRQKKIWIACLLLLNIGGFGIMARLNTPYTNPPWPHHMQYHQLAVALTEGRVSIEVGAEEILSALSNPYDTGLRDAVLGTDPGWDTAYYQGKFYVYFGIVPVLFFYLPYYVLFHRAFPTWLGIVLTGAMLLAGAFYLVYQLIKNYFPKTPFVLYLLLSLMLGNGVGTIPIMLRPDYYSLPILCAICLTVWGLGFWVKALSMWKKPEEQSGRFHMIPYLFGGSLCLALTAGCRPQFLVGTFLLIPLCWQQVQKVPAENRIRSKNIPYMAAVLLPYLAVAMGLMYYNFIRFGSVFDFGANYNLTTNDMTHREISLGRLPDGIFLYLFQFPDIGLQFPFVNNVPLHSGYTGLTIRELMFGGIFFTHIFLCVLFLLRSVRGQLASKGLYGMSVGCVLAGIIIVMADTEMAGILNRYYADFLWVFSLVAILVFLQLWENASEAISGKRLTFFLLAGGICGLFMDCCIGIVAGNLQTNNAHLFYILKTLLTI